jgi:hypothetical protein
MLKQVWLCALVVLMAATVRAADEPEGFEVHDMKRPQPVEVTPGHPSTQEQPGTAPSDAVVLFDGKDLSKWKSSKEGDAAWTVGEGYFQVAPGKGNIETRDQFGDVQLHIEWREPEDVKGESQGRGNSGVFLQGLYEVQVLDNSNGHKTYPDGSAGGIYGQYPPLVNPTRAPGQWNMYDIVFHTAKLENGKVAQPARVTVLFNGVLVQDNMELIGPTQHKFLASYPSDLPDKGPLQLQDHMNPVRYRNVWIRELKQERPKPPVKPAGAGH